MQSRSFSPLGGFFAIAAVLSVCWFFYHVTELRAAPTFCGPVCKNIKEYRVCSPALCYKMLWNECWVCTRANNLCNRTLNAICAPTISYNWRALGTDCTTVCPCGDGIEEVESMMTVGADNYMLWELIYTCTTRVPAG